MKEEGASRMPLRRQVVLPEADREKGKFGASGTRPNGPLCAG